MSNIADELKDKEYGLTKGQVAVLESLLKHHAETKPQMENTILSIAQKCGLENVVQRIKRLRRYAKARGGGRGVTNRNNPGRTHVPRKKKGRDSVPASAGIPG